MRKTLLTTLFLLCLFGVARAQKADYGGRVSIDANAVNVKPQFSTFKSVKKHAPMRDASVVFFDDFESGSLSQWTIYTEGGAPFADGWCTFDMNDPNFDNSFDAHSGHYVASAWSWNGSSYNADNWLVTPQVALGGTLKFWVVTHPNYPDSYEVKLSTTGNAVADFTVTLQDMAPALTADHGEWKEVTIDLSAYEGQQGYIAIHHQCFNENYLFIDDFGIYAADPPITLTVFPTATESDNHIPAFIFYWDDFTKSQCVIPASELTALTGKEITSMKFYTTSSYVPYTSVSTADFFLKEVESETISAYIDKADATIVYSGTVNIVAAGDGGEMTITFSTPFTYNGGNLLIGSENTTDAGYKNIYFIGESGHTGAALYGYNSSSLDAVPANSSTFLPKTTFYTGGSTPPVTAETPTNVAVSEITESSAKVSWDGAGDSFAYRYRPVAGGGAKAPQLAGAVSKAANPNMPRRAKDAAWQEGSTSDNYVTLEGLDAETQYEVQVQSVVGATNSEWSAAVNFTTLAAGVACDAPTDLAVSDITDQSATVSWNGDADGYEMEIGTEGSGSGEAAVYDFNDGTLQGWTNLIVNSDGGEWLHSDNNPGGYDYSPFMDNGFVMCYSFIDYDGAYDTDAYLVSPQAFDIVAGSQLTFKANQANVSYPESFSVCVAETTGTPTAADFTVVATPTVSTGYDDTPTEISVDLSAYAGKSIWIAFHDQNYDAYEIWIDDIAISGAKKRAITWTPVGEVSSPYELTGLDPETEYSVRVRSVCGGSTSDWVETSFTTLAAGSVVEVPTDLTIDNITDQSATATWSGSNDTYTLRYRPVEDALPGAGSSFSVDFESGLPEGWTTIDADGDGYDWLLASDLMGTGYGHNGSDDCILSQSYSNDYGALYPDNYLVSPQVNIGAGSTFSFYACGQDASYAAEHFGVAVSTTSNSDASAFTTLNEWTMTAAPGMKKGPGKNGAPNRVQGNWYQYTVDLSAYAGQQVYIAIRHFNCADMFYLDVDDIALTSDTKDAKKAPRREAAEWTTLDVAETTAELTGLEPETTYEVQVQGVTGGEVSDWTDVVTFTTLAAPAVEVPTDLAISEITSESAVATWSGTTDTYNIRYREVTASTDAVTVTLTTDDVWGDGSGYQMLLDADANAFGSVIPETGALTTGGDVDESIYAEFEYKIPENADGALATSNIVLDNSVSIEIPAGTYDWCITNPTPGDRMWIGSAQGNVGGRADDYTFEAGKVYEFHVYISGANDATDVTITDARGAAEWTTVEDVTSPYSLTGLTAETEYEVQVQGVTGGVASDWSASVLFTTTEGTGINGLKVAGQENWYTIDGRKLAKRPTTAGVYILNGTKVMIK